MTTRARQVLSALRDRAPLAGLAAAALLVLVLARQRAELRADLRELRDRAEWPHAGLPVPTFDAATLAGDSLTVGAAPAGHTQVLFVFNTRCPYCRRSIPEWNRLAGLAAARPDLHVYGISLDPDSATRAYVRDHAVAFPVTRFPEPKLVELYRVTGVPLTLVLDAEGRVLEAFRGLVGPAVADSIERLVARPPH